MPPSTSAATPTTGSGVSAGRKEVEAIPVSSAESQLREVGYDAELPKEVAAAGVKAQPTHVPVPPPVVDMGVTSTGANSPPAGQEVAVPLTDDQIALGLTQGINQSFRWLAQWCLRRLDQLHISFRVTGGKIRRKA